MPTTFDETMVEFGFKLERKRVLDEVLLQLKDLDEAVKADASEKVRQEQVVKIHQICEGVI